MKVKHLKKGELRVIRIGREAIYELLRENMIENAEQYFDLLDMRTVTFQMIWSSQTDEFTCVVHDDQYTPNIDIENIAEKVSLTTETLFQKHRFQTIFIPLA